jgi:hypothetical protein
MHWIRVAVLRIGPLAGLAVCRAAEDSLAIIAARPAGTTAWSSTVSTRMVTPLRYPANPGPAIPRMGYAPPRRAEHEAAAHTERSTVRPTAPTGAEWAPQG